MQVYAGIPTVSGMSADFDHRGLVVTWRTDGPAPNHSFETFLLSTWIQRRDGRAGVQLGLKFINGDEPVVFRFDHETAQQVNDPHPHGRVGSRAESITVIYPADWFDEFTGSQRLRGTANENGQDVGGEFWATVSFDRE